MTKKNKSLTKLGKKTDLNHPLKAGLYSEKKVKITFDVPERMRLAFKKNLLRTNKSQAEELRGFIKEFNRSADFSKKGKQDHKRRR